MTESLREWLMSLVAVSLVWSVAEAVTPSGLCRRVCRMVGGLLMILVMLQPLRGVTGLDIAGELKDCLETYQADGAGEYGEDLMEEVIIRSAQAYIEKRAQELGGTVEAEVTCRQTEGLFLPDRVTVTGTLTEEQWSELSGLMEQELEIPAERQRYREAGA